LAPDQPTDLLTVLLSRGVGRRVVRRVVAETWAAGGALSDATARLKADYGLELPRRSDVANDRREIDRLGVRILWMLDTDYPAALRATPDPPIAMFMRGSASALARPLNVAIVGSRRATIQGCEFARALATDLGRAGIAVVSGLALGIDGSAHRGALDVSGVTVAVMGGGHGKTYPMSHARLAEEIATNAGALVAEYPPSSAPLRGNFPERNRIISGLGAGVVVVEATDRSGTLITARMALEQGREVMAVPGPVLGRRHAGCHRLIKQGAALVEGASDVLEAFGLTLPDDSVPEAPSDPELAVVLEAISHAVTPLHDIVTSLGRSVDEVLGALVTLEIEGFVETHRGGYIRRPSTTRNLR
jgi:DNA processing protein